MAREVVMPQLGLSMDSGKILRWCRQSGDRVAAGDVLLEVESDKATVEVEAVAVGILQLVKGPEDGEIAVGAVIGYLLSDGERSPVDAESTEVPASIETAPQSQRRLPSSPAARRRAQELHIDWRRATGTGARGRIKVRDVEGLASNLQEQATRNSQKPVAISPVARRLAEAVGLDLGTLESRCSCRRIERSDIEQAIRERLVLGSSVQPTSVSTAESKPDRRPMSRVRRITAERMAHSAHSTASVTLNLVADGTELIRMREGWKREQRFRVSPSYSALFVKLVAKALREYPNLNTSLDGEDIVYWDTINVAIAVETDHGLMVPVVKGVLSKSLEDVVIEVAALLERTKEGRATSDDLSGSTFTITNLGVYGIDAFTPIINPPECAILGLGRFFETMTVQNGTPTVRTVITLNLSFDHRLVDGGEAARFLGRIKHLVEQPYLWLV